MMMRRIGFRGGLVFGVVATFCARGEAAGVPSTPNGEAVVTESTASAVLRGVVVQVVPPIADNSQEQVRKWAAAAAESARKDPRRTPKDAEDIARQALQSVESSIKGRTITTTFTLSLATDGFVWDYRNSDQPELKMAGVMAADYSDHATMSPQHGYTIERDFLKPRELWYPTPWFFVPAVMARFYEQAEWTTEDDGLVLTMTGLVDATRQTHEFPFSKRMQFVFASAPPHKLQRVQLDEGADDLSNTSIIPDATAPLVAGVLPTSYTVVAQSPGNAPSHTVVMIQNTEAATFKSVQEIVPWKAGDNIRDSRFHATEIFRYPYDPKQTQADIAAAGKPYFEKREEFMRNVQNSSKGQNPPKGQNTSLFNRMKPEHYFYALGGIVLLLCATIVAKRRLFKSGR